MSDKKELTAAEWCREENVSILDPDGWGYEGGAKDFFEKQISREEFLKKLRRCTTKNTFEQIYIDSLRALYDASISQSTQS